MYDWFKIAIGALHMQKRIESSKVLACGGAGLLGSHLCGASFPTGHDAIGADIVVTCSRSNIARLLGEPSFKLLPHDAVLPLLVNVDEICNLGEAR